jgi:multidrug efflux system membrane fusion protein
MTNSTFDSADRVAAGTVPASLGRVKSATDIRQRIKRHPREFLLAGIVGVLVVVLTGWLLFHHQPAKTPAPQPIPVSAAKALVQDVPVSITALGAAQAWTSDTILAQVNGKLLSVDFVEGTNVKAGQLLARVDPGPYLAALTQVQGALQRDRALLAGARVDLARYQALVVQGAVSNLIYGDQLALVNQDEGIVLLDEGAVANAQINLDRCGITSPISGRTGVRMVDPGNLVTAGTVNSSTTSGTTGSTTSATGIVVVNQIEPIAVTFSVPQGDYERLSELSDGFRKPLTTLALSEETGALLGTGELSIADNRVNPTTGSVEMKARFPNTSDRLLPGQFVNIHLTLQTLSRVVTIPAAAVNQGPNGPYVYVIGPDKKVLMRRIKVGVTQGEIAVITTGLKAGEIVVTDGQMSVVAGSMAKVGAPAPVERSAP